MSGLTPQCSVQKPTCYKSVCTSKMSQKGQCDCFRGNKITRNNGTVTCGGQVDEKGKVFMRESRTATTLSSQLNNRSRLWYNTIQTPSLNRILLRVTRSTLSNLAKAGEVLARTFARDGARGMIGCRVAGTAV